MAEFTLHQQQDQVAHLGRDIFHDEDGHNLLSASISGSDLSRAWLEFSLDGTPFEKLQEFSDADYQYPFSNTPDGTVISGISIREAIDVEWESSDQEKLVFYYCEEHDGSSQKIRRAVSSEGDPTTVDGPGTTVIEESDKAEDPNLFYDPETDEQFLFMEDNSNHGQLAIQKADSRAGESFSTVEVVGQGQWDLDAAPASPTAWRYNGTQLLSGEDHQLSDQPMMVASGPDPLTYDSYIHSADPSDYSGIERHFNLQGSCYIDRNGVFHSYSQVYDGSTFVPVHVTTSTYDSENRPTEPWTVTMDDPNELISGLVRYVNGFYAYREINFSELQYWEIPGSVRERSLSSDGGDVEWEWYEPTAPVGGQVGWRVAAEDANGNVERSGTKYFGIGAPPSLPSVAAKTIGGARQTKNGVVQLQNNGS